MYNKIKVKIKTLINGIFSVHNDAAGTSCITKIALKKGYKPYRTKKTFLPEHFDIPNTERS